MRRRYWIALTVVLGSVVLVDDAAAIIGRPMVRGTARRTARRTVRRTAVVVSENAAPVPAVETEPVKTARR